MWYVLNRLFGWDYVAWSNSAAQGVARVHNDGTGRCYYWRYKGTQLADEIKTEEQVFWLTCEPSKYLVKTEAQ